MRFALDPGPATDPTAMGPADEQPTTRRNRRRIKKRLPGQVWSGARHETGRRFIFSLAPSSGSTAPHCYCYIVYLIYYILPLCLATPSPSLPFGTLSLLCLPACLCSLFIATKNNNNVSGQTGSGRRHAALLRSEPIAIRPLLLVWLCAQPPRLPAAVAARFLRPAPQPSPSSSPPVTAAAFVTVPVQSPVTPVRRCQFRPRNRGCRRRRSSCCCCQGSRERASASRRRRRVLGRLSGRPQRPVTNRARDFRPNLGDSDSAGLLSRARPPLLLVAWVLYRFDERFLVGISSLLHFCNDV
ncbi:hypothetical protein V1525DRAFT_408390 [Lipomyces kononenkoae]|uniref:Uncharacterized protein n=1 Tax=Lipomyces kononenkoae TaxID=34357 RepID=A0ACC3SX62_LIPKO